MLISTFDPMYNCNWNNSVYAKDAKAIDDFFRWQKGSLPSYCEFKTAEEYNAWRYNLLSGYSRNLKYRSRPNSTVLDGLLNLRMNSSDDDEFLYHWFLKGEMCDGTIEIYGASEEDIPFRRIEFWDAFITSIGEQTSYYTPMTMDFVISPAIIRYNRKVVFRKSWFITDIEQKKSTQATNTEDEVEKKPQCTLHFRRSEHYEGEFGFDWLRAGDTGEFGDVWYRNIMPQSGQYDQLTSKEYIHFEQEWKKDHPKYKQNYQYTVPWVTITPNSAIPLRLKIEAEEVTGDIVLKFRNNEAGHLSIDFDKIIDIRTDTYYHKKNLKVTCSGTFTKDIYLDAYMGDSKVGSLAFVRNMVKEIPIAVINVKILNPNPDPKKKELFVDLSTIETLKENLAKYLGQAYLKPTIVDLDLNEVVMPDIKITRNRYTGKDEYFINIVYTKGGETKNVKVDKNSPIFNNYFVNKGKVVFYESEQLSRTWGNLHLYLDLRLQAKYGDIYNQHYRIYFINSAGTVAGVAGDIPSQVAIVFESGIADPIVPTHELLHCLGLYHPFQLEDRDEYKFEQYRTDNMMDYDEGDDAVAKQLKLANFSDRHALWYWQIKKIWEGLAWKR